MSVYHKHHIIPRHMGGTDDPDNLVEVTVEQHALLHKQLWEDLGHWQDKVAWLTLSSQISKAEATIMAIKATNTGRKLSPEHIANRTKSQKGLKRSTETKARMSEAKRNISPETRKKRSDAAKGKSPSAETRRKLSEANRGKKHSPETIEKFSRSLRGRKHSPEHCKKISDALKRRTISKT